MTITFLPGCTLSSNISTKLSLSGRDCSWKKPRACPTEKNKTHRMVPYQRAYQIRSGQDRGTSGI